MVRLLYIEDDAEHCLFVSKLLTSRGFVTEMARDGIEGVEKAHESQPDLILLDLFLPFMDGFGVMEHLNENTTTQDIPVIVISAWPTGDNRKRVREAGAVGFITKPFKIDDLVKLIRESLPQLVPS
jgi:CheY-like chemotaxis protein